MSERCSGQIAIVGRPNVGKSTLLNALVGEKLSIVSRRAQTTRHRIIGVLTRADAQYVFVDTPGFQTRHGNALNRVMNRGVRQALAEVDVVFLVVEAGRFDERDRQVRRLVPADRPLIIVVSKIDQEDEITDRSERFLASEFLREKLFRLLGDELPYGIAVEIEKFEVEATCAASMPR
jgi:GTP-binding protein Era